MKFFRVPRTCTLFISVPMVMQDWEVQGKKWYLNIGCGLTSYFMCCVNIGLLNCCLIDTALLSLMCCIMRVMLSRNIGTFYATCTKGILRGRVLSLYLCIL